MSKRAFYPHLKERGFRLNHRHKEGMKSCSIHAGKRPLSHLDPYFIAAPRIALFLRLELDNARFMRPISGVS